MAEYRRKKPDSVCYVGSGLDTRHQILRQNCSCSIYDFECDYNYQRATDGTCQLIPGLDPPNHSIACEEPAVSSWTEPTGYRKIPLTTCTGGKTFDEGVLHACPGHEKELERVANGLKGFALFIVICIPFILASGLGYVLWKYNGSRTFGQIRLGDDTFDQNISSGRDRMQEYVLIVVSGLSTIILSVPTVMKFIWQGISSRVTRSRPAYYQSLQDDSSLLSDDDAEFD